MNINNNFHKPIINSNKLKRNPLSLIGKKNSIRTHIEKKVKTILKKETCDQKIPQFFKNSFTWLKSLPSKVSQFFKNCFQSLKEKNLTEIEKRTLRKEQTPQPKIKHSLPSTIPNPSTHVIQNQAPITSKNSLVSLPEIKERSLAINPLHTNLNTEFEKNPMKNVQEVNKDFKDLFPKSLFKIPPKLTWNNNNCWLHASLEILWAWNPYFSDLICKKIEQVNELKKFDKNFENVFSKDSIIYLGALKTFNDAIKTGKDADFQKAAENIQKAIVRIFPELKTPGNQQDAQAFLLFTLEFLSKPFFEIQTTRQGLGDLFHNFQTVYNPDPTYLLKLNFNGKTQFQEILNTHFTPMIENQIKNQIVMNGFYINHYSEKQKIISKVPEFIFVHILRYEVDVNDEKPAGVYQRAEKKNKQRRNQVTSVEDAKNNLPQVNFKLKKISTAIQFPVTNKINFAKAFGAEDNDPMYDYTLKASLIHEGHSANEGHYTANVLTTTQAEKEQWYYCNNLGSQVIPLSNKEAQYGNSNGYVYYFEKVKRG